MIASKLTDKGIEIATMIVKAHSNTFGRIQEPEHLIKTISAALHKAIRLETLHWPEVEDETATIKK